MTILLGLLAYAFGFAFFLGYARGHDADLVKPSWHHALLVAVIWPVFVFWLGVRDLEKDECRWLALVLLLLAAPARATFTITVSTSGPSTPSAVITSSPSGISCPSTCTFAFAEGSTVTLSEVHPSTIAFVAWAGPDGCRTNRRSCDVRLSANANVTARFDPALDLSFSGSGVGVVTSSFPATGSAGQSCTNAISSGTCSNGSSIRMVLPVGTQVILTASTATSSAFTGWSGSGSCAAASTCTFTLNGYTAIVATFTASAASYPLRITLPIGGGTVTSSPAGISCPGVCSSTFTANAFVTFTTAAASGYRFAGWANGGCSKNNVCVVQSTSPLQGLGGKYSPAAYFYRINP